MKYCLVDMSNLVFRARYAVKSKDTEDVTGMAFHIVMHAMLKVYQKFGAHKMIACFDAGSWRKQVYPEYKAHRGDRDTPQDVEIKQIIGEMLGEFHTFMQTETNVFSFKRSNIEADDFIYRWIVDHPNDQHVILSSDGDYKQIVSPSVELYDGMSNTLYRHDGTFICLEGARPKKTDIVKTLYHDQWKVKVDKEGNPETFDPNWLLFEKLMKGDISDNIPRVIPPRYLTKKLKLMFESETGDEFTEMMLATREDLEDNPVMETLFMRNVSLIDMTAIPDDIVAKISETMEEESNKPKAPRIGMNLLKFCKKMKLNSVAGNAQAFAMMFSA